MVSVRRPHALPVDIPQDIGVHHVRRLRCLHEHCTLNCADIPDHVACDTRVPVVPVEPDPRSSLNVFNSIRPHQSPVVYQELYAGYLPVELSILPTTVGDGVALHQCMLVGEAADTRCSAFMYEIVSHDCMAQVGILPLRIASVQTLEDVESDFYAHGIDMAHRAVLDDPVMPSHSEHRPDAGAQETVGTVLEDQSVHSDESETYTLRFEKMRLYGRIKDHSVRITAAIRVDVDSAPVRRYPE